MIRALLIDDSALARKFLTESLNRTGSIQVIASAASGQDAMRILAETTPDVIITDLQMPGMHGEVIVKVFHRQIPVIVITSSDTDDAKVIELRQVAKAVVLKPKVDAEVDGFCTALFNAVTSAVAP